MTYKKTQEMLNSNEAMVLIKSIPMENWSSRRSPGTVFDYHAYHVMGGNEVHVEISGRLDRLTDNCTEPGRRYEAQVYVDGHRIGESCSREIQSIHNSLVAWKYGRDKKFVEVIRGNRKIVENVIIRDIRACLAKRN